MSIGVIQEGDTLRLTIPVHLSIERFVPGSPPTLKFPVGTLVNVEHAFGARKGAWVHAVSQGIRVRVAGKATCFFVWPGEYELVET